MNCPKCGAMMDPVTYSTVEVDRCDMCRGMWFDAIEKDLLKKIAGAEDMDIGEARVGKPFDDKTDITCPRCKSRMISMVDLDQPHIHYEACTVCGGVFFDAGEFRDLKSETPVDFFRKLMARRKR